MKKGFLLFFASALIMCVFLSCDKDENEIIYTFDDVELIRNDTYVIPNGEAFVWEVQDTTIAKVDGNVLTAVGTGYTTVFSGSYSFVVVVHSVILYDEPCTSWGASKEDIKLYMADYKLGLEEEDLLAYYGNRLEKAIYYFFDDKNTLEYLLVDLKLTETLLEDWIDFMSERYDFEFSAEDEENEDITRYFFISRDKKNLITTTFDFSGEIPAVYTVYIPYPSSRTVVNDGIQCIYKLFKERQIVY